MDKSLLTPYTLGPLELPNRMVMAPMTRNRNDENGVPKAMAATHYAQRATAGLLISEATQVSANASGYMFTPGIFTDDQVRGWQAVTDAVHAEGGRIFNQVWHTGRVSHPSLQPDGGDPLAPSAIKADTMVFTPNGFEPASVPRALATDEIPVIVEQFAHAARLAKQAGFDGVEVHGANGYLIEQFLKDGSNQRSDRYGGSIPARMRFALEVVTAVVEVWGPDRVGFRISPRGNFNDMHDSDPLALFSQLVAALNDFPLAYLHLIEPLPGHPSFTSQEGTDPVAKDLRRIYNGTLIINGGYGKETGQQAIADGTADLVAFGVPYLANPDLVERYRRDAPLNEPDEETFYGGDEKGYNDYPFL
jgi:N-ethylmaleimide reductase